MRVIDRAIEGNRYRLRGGQHQGCDVLCIVGGVHPLVSLLHPDGEWPFPSAPFSVKLSDLEPMPMRYYQGAVPQ